MAPQVSHSLNSSTDLGPRCQTIAGASPFPMAAVDASTFVICYANEAFCLLLGQSNIMLTGTLFSAAIPRGEASLSLLRRVRETGQAEIHTGQEHPSAHPLFWSYAMWPVASPAGQVLAVMIQVTETARFHEQSTAMNQALMIGSLRQNELVEEAEALNEQLESEIARRELAYRALAESENRYHALFEALPVAAFVCDEDATLQSYNPRAVELWGRAPQGGLEKDCASRHLFLPEGTPWPEQTPQARVLRTGIAERNMEALLERPDASRLPVIMNFAPLKDADGQVVGVVTAFDDITERKRAQEEIRRVSERFRFMAESMPQKILTTTSIGEVDYFNKQWMNFTGLAFEEIEGWGWKGFLHPEDLEGTIRLWSQALATGAPYHNVHRFRRADGEYHWHLTRAVAMFDAAGNISMWLGSSTDIHEEKLAEERLRRANEDLKQFAFAASHDLQEPLRMITCYSDLLMVGDLTKLDSEAAFCLEMMTKGASQMKALLADLLAYAEAGADKDEAAEAIDLNEVWQQAIKNLQQAIDETGAVVTRADLPRVNGDHSRYVQLLQNLIGNAIKYRGERTPMIHISAERQDGQWTFAVADNGMGIAPDYHRQIFGVFKRLHGRAIPGTGIGLALCHRVVESYGGKIWVESELGAGATFYFTLPAKVT